MLGNNGPQAQGNYDTFIAQLAVAAGLLASWHVMRERMYIGQSRDNSVTYTRARHVRVLEQRGVIKFIKED